MMAQSPRFLVKLSALCVGISLLSGCSGLFGATPDPVVRTEVAEVNIPPANRSCPANPTPPDPDDPNVTQRDVAVYIIDLQRVAEECRRDLRTTVQIIDDYNSTARELNAQDES